MATETYEAALARLLAHEGGYVNHPRDPGGPTNFGITIFDYRRYVKATATALDVKNMKIADAKAIYRAKYWDSQLCDKLEPGVDYAIFDYGVNSGIGRSGRVLRRIIGLSDKTSTINLPAAAASCRRDAAWLVDAICDERLGFLKGLSTWRTFGRGWARRVDEVRTFSLAIARDLPVDDAPLAPAAGRAIEPDKFGRVRALQTALRAGGFDPGAIDGDLGPNTVRAFQRSRGLRADGIVGAKTRPLLDQALAAAAPLPTRLLT